MVTTPTRVKLITPPASPVLTLTEAKAHLRVVDSDDDILIADLVAAATGYCEGFCGRAFIDQTWDLYLDSFPTLNDMEIRVPLPPLIEVVHVAYNDTIGDEQIMDTADYYVDTVSEPGWIVPQTTLTWPTPIDAINSVRVRFRAGFLSTDSPPVDDVPESLKSAVRLTLGALHEHREQVGVGTTTFKLPWGAEQLMRQYRVFLGMA